MVSVSSSKSSKELRDSNKENFEMIAVPSFDQQKFGTPGKKSRVSSNKRSGINEISSQMERLALQGTLFSESLDGDFRYLSHTLFD